VTVATFLNQRDLVMGGVTAPHKLGMRIDRFWGVEGFGLWLILTAEFAAAICLPDDGGNLLNHQHSNRSKKPSNQMKTTSFTFKLALAATALAVTAITTDAASVAINNFSFETPTVASDGTFVVAPGASGANFNGWGWVKTTGSGFQDYGIENQGSGAYTGAAGTGTPVGADGINNAFLNQSIGGGVQNIFQDVGLLLPDTTYTLTLAIGQRLDRVNGSVTFGLINAAAGNLDPWATGLSLATTTGVSSVAGSFQDFVVTFSTGSTVSDELYIGAQYLGDGTIQGGIDNFRLDAAPVPEPGMLALAALGGLGLFAAQRRMRKA
jgi:PEP-CTERM motif